MLRGPVNLLFVIEFGHDFFPKPHIFLMIVFITFTDLALDHRTPARGLDSTEGTTRISHIFLELPGIVQVDSVDLVVETLRVYIHIQQQQMLGLYVEVGQYFYYLSQRQNQTYILFFQYCASMEFITSYSSADNVQPSDRDQDRVYQTSSKDWQSRINNFQKDLCGRFIQHSIPLVYRGYNEDIDPKDALIKQPQHILFSFILNSIYRAYQYLVDIAINIRTLSLRINIATLENGLYLNIKKSGISQTIFRYCAKFNARMHRYALKFNYLEGTVKITLTEHFKKPQINLFMNFPAQLMTYIVGEVQDMLKIWQSHIFHKIMLLANKPTPILNQIPMNEQADVNYPKDYCKIINDSITSISSLISNSHIQYPFMNEPQKDGHPRIKFFTRTKSRKQKKQLIPNIHLSDFQRNRTYLLKDIEECMRFMTNNCDKEQTKDLLIQEEEIERFKVNHLRIDKMALSPPKILTKLHKVEVIGEQTFIEKGGFAEIWKMNVKVIHQKEKSGFSMNNPQREQPNTQKMVLVKKKACENKLWYEKSVIRQMGSYNCLYIQKYYEIENEMSENTMYMDYCSKKSLNAYLAHYKGIMSLQLKLAFLNQVIIGLRFLRDSNIVHLDLKPENILLRAYRTVSSSSFLVLRLIDFGESFCSNLLINENLNTSTQTRRGFTIPYASPEIIKQDPCSDPPSGEDRKKQYIEKSDVYSFGVMMLMMIFEINTTQIKRLGAKKFYSDQYTNLYNICIEKCRYYGYQPLMMCLLNLAFKCIRPQKYMRPFLDWICVILKEAEMLLDQLAR